MKDLTFRKRVMRNDFTNVFGGIGRRRSVGARRIKKRSVKRFRIQQIRRAHQGWRNKTFGMIQSLRIRRVYGRRPNIPQFRTR